MILRDKHGNLLGTARSFWRDYSRDKFALLGLLLFGALALLAATGHWLIPFDPVEQLQGELLLPPYWYSGGAEKHLFGTDDLGRDLLSRLIAGARLSLGVGFGVVLAALGVGVVLGALAAALRGAAGSVLVRLMELLLALPSLLLAVLLVAILGPSLSHAALAIGLVLMPGFMRVTRAAIHEELAKDYITAARLDGASPWRLFTRSVLPNIAPALTLHTTHALSTAILDIAALGFLGLGAQSPVPEWGTILAESRAYIQQAPWTVTLPGLAILLTVLSINLIGNGLRQALDPHSKR